MHYEGIDTFPILQGQQPDTHRYTCHTLEQNSAQANDLHSMWKKAENIKQMKRMVDGFQDEEVCSHNLIAQQQTLSAPSTALLPLDAHNNLSVPGQGTDKAYLSGTQSMPILTSESITRQSISNGSWPTNTAQPRLVLSPNVWVGRTGSMQDNTEGQKLSAFRGSDSYSHRSMHLSDDQSRRSYSVPSPSMSDGERNQALSSVHSFPGQYGLTQMQVRDLNPLGFTQTRKSLTTVDSAQDIKFEIMDMLNRASASTSEPTTQYSTEVSTQHPQANHINCQPRQYQSISMFQGDLSKSDQPEIQLYTKGNQQRRQSTGMAQSYLDTMQQTTSIPNFKQAYNQSHPMQVLPTLNDTTSGQFHTQTSPQAFRYNGPQPRRYSTCNNGDDLKKNGRGKVKSSKKEQECTHCRTTKTTTWRRLEGKLVCNACGLYFKTKGRVRPLTVQQKAKQTQSLYTNHPF